MFASDNGGGDFTPAPVGNHLARCIKLIDLGTKDNTYQGKTTKRHQIMVFWELPSVLIQEGDLAGKPFTVSKFYTLSLSEKANLRKDLVSWRGREFTEEEKENFDMANILDKCCMLNVVHEKEKAKVASIAALPQGVDCPPRVNDLLLFSLHESLYDPAKYDKLSDWQKGQVQESDEWKAMDGWSAPVNSSAPPANSYPEQAPPINDSDIPF